jgi:hypothetical protein
MRPDICSNPSDEEFWRAGEDALVARLAKRGPERLARFILTLAHHDNGIGRYVQAFILADNPERCAEVLQGTIAEIAAGERSYDRRHALDTVFLRRLDHVLDLIEGDLLPNSPTLARSLLAHVLEKREAIENHLHEADTEETFRRAGELHGRAIAEAGAAGESVDGKGVP